MGVLIHEHEVPSVIPPVKLFQIFFLENEHYLPKILPQVIKNIEILEGDGGAGSIKKTNFVEGLEVKYVKNKVDAVDKNNFIYNYTTFEGEPWMNTLDKISYENQTIESPNGGSITKCTIKYYSKGDAKLDVDKIKKDEEKANEMLKAVENYLLINPDV